MFENKNSWAICVRGDFFLNILLKKYLGPIVSYLESSSGSIEASIVIARTSSWILLELPVLSGSMLNKLSKTELKVLVPFGSWSHLIKFRYSEKTTTIWKNLPLFLTLLGNFKKVGDVFKTILPSQNIWTLPFFMCRQQEQHCTTGFAFLIMFVVSKYLGTRYRSRFFGKLDMKPQMHLLEISQLFKPSFSKLGF